MGIDTNSYLQNYSVQQNNGVGSSKTSQYGSSAVDMDMFLKLLAAQLQNQDPLNPMKDSEYMTQMAQMATVEAVSTITDVAKTNYAASLVGKEVTIAEIDNKGKMQEVVGTVTGAGLYSGDQIVFVNGQGYSLSNIMCVGRIPEEKSTVADSTMETSKAQAE